jgi:hypothetical protein
VESEQATIPQILADNPGIYSGVEIRGSLEESSSSSHGADDELQAVVFYEYMYANPVDWSTGMATLDAQRPAFATGCRSTIFPAMRTAGITGPMGVTFSYDDGESEFGAMWHHTCQS